MRKRAKKITIINTLSSHSYQKANGKKLETAKQHVQTSKITLQQEALISSHKFIKRKQKKKNIHCASDYSIRKKNKSLKVNISTLQFKFIQIVIKQNKKEVKLSHKLIVESTA